MNDDLETRWHEATKELISKIEEKGEKLDTFDALEMFGRDGSWHTKVYADKVRSLEIWELDERWYHDLKGNFPNAIVKITDSIAKIKNETDLPKFGFIVIDNPMNTFGTTNESDIYCEHFDVMTNIDKIIAEQAIVIFNVNKNPFNYEKFPLWKKRRMEFYGVVNTSNLSIDFVIKFYKKLFEKLGFMTIFYVTVVRVLYKKREMTYYFAYKLKRV